MSRIYDLAIVGASFSGLACARVAAERGLTTLVIDRKPVAGHRMHTTGLLVKEAADKLNVPSHLTRQIKGVRLYSPNLRYVDLEAPGYYFLATDIQSLMTWLASDAQSAGSELRFGAAYRGASREASICNCMTCHAPGGSCVGPMAPLPRWLATSI